MFKEIDYTFLTEIQSRAVNLSSIPKTIKISDYFKNLLQSGIIIKTKIGKGYNIELNLNEKENFLSFYRSIFPNIEKQNESHISNTAKFRDSKSSKNKSNNIVMFRGFNLIHINKVEIPLHYYTEEFGLFSVKLKDTDAKYVCFVENLDSFLVAEKIIDRKFTFIHTYGRVGIEIIKKLNPIELIVFSDYDFVGLNEYLKFKEIFPETNFFMPENFDFLFDNYSKPLKNKNGKAQKPSNRVLSSTDNNVIYILDKLQKTNNFLEQQALFIQ